MAAERAAWESYVTGRNQLRIAIIGAGASGLMALIKLREEGYSHVTVFEKAGDLGGTWRDNRYPGLTCDVPSLAYRYSFAPSVQWSRTCAPGAEIQAYLKRVANDHGAERHIRFGEEVTSAQWNGSSWILSTTKEADMPFEVVITAVGVLHHPVIPDINGLADFGGPHFHSARWPDDLDVTGKRVGVIGTGSTAVQLISALVDQASSVTMFQRTAQWVLPLPNPAVTPEERQRLEQDPAALAAEYDRLNDEATGKFAAAIVGENPSAYRTMTRLCGEYLATVRDPELRVRLTPDYPVGCKRLVMSDSFYEAIQRDNATLVTNRIAQVEANGVRTADGSLHALDVLVLATGFNTHQFFRPMRVIGKNGVELDRSWDPENISYLGVTTPDLPNWFMIGGPHSPIGNFSWLLTAETQFGYIRQLIALIAAGEAREIVPSREAATAFREAVREKIPTTVWAQGCSSWYIDPNGNVASWPWTYARFQADMATPRLEDFEIAA
jgi:cyclohexanone monooxygenase